MATNTTQKPSKILKQNLTPLQDLSYWKLSSIAIESINIDRSALNEKSFLRILENVRLLPNNSKLRFMEPLPDCEKGQY